LVTTFIFRVFNWCYICNNYALLFYTFFYPKCNSMKIKYILPIVTFFVFSFFDTSAQTTSIGVRGGMSIPNLTGGSSADNPLNSGFKSRVGGDAAVFVDFGITPTFSIRPMIQFSQQGGKKDGFQAFPTPAEMAPLFAQMQMPVPTYLYATFKNTAKFNYLLIPVLANFGWNVTSQSPVRLYVNAGPFAGFLLSAHQVTSGQSDVFADDKGQVQLPIPGGKQSFDAKTDIKDDLHTFNAGAEANVGVGYKLGKSGNLFIEGGFNYGFIKIQKGEANGKNNTGAGTVALGYAHQL